MSAPSSNEEAAAKVQLCEAARRSLLYKALCVSRGYEANRCTCDPEDLCDCLHRRTLRFLLVSKGFLSAFFSRSDEEGETMDVLPTIMLSSRVTLQSARWKHVGTLWLTGAHLPEGSAFLLARLLRVADLEAIGVQLGSFGDEYGDDSLEMELASEHHDDRMAVLGALKTHSTLKAISLSVMLSDDEDTNEQLAEVPDKIVSLTTLSFDQCALFKDRQTVMDELEIDVHEHPESNAIVETFQVPCRVFKIPFASILELEQDLLPNEHVQSVEFTATCETTLIRWEANEWAAGVPRRYQAAFARMRSLNDAFTITIKNVEDVFLADAKTDPQVKKTMELLFNRSIQLVDCAHEAGVRLHQLFNILYFKHGDQARERKEKQVATFLQSKKADVVEGVDVPAPTQKVVRQLERHGTKILFAVVA
ncbi:hypothetical protein M3Y99_00937500 [Aphelenchoides fujianensis]|nr:hypothetical protein M3Y99_00937500 [Aphelenchoides fujianensis]